MNIVNKSFHTIDVENNIVEALEISDGFDDFILDAFVYADKNEKNKIYTVKDEDNEIFQSIKNITIEGSDASSFQKIIAQKLLESEINAQGKIFSTGKNVKKGSLIQALIQNNGNYFYFMAKVEHTEWIDGKTLVKYYGFSSDKKNVWKTAVIPFYEINGSVIFEDCKLYNDTKAKYWFLTFLDVEEKRDDYSNTQKAFQAIDAELKSNLQSSSIKDYIKLSSRLQDTMNQNEEMNYNSYIEEFIDTYEPVSPEVEKAVIKDCLLALPDRKNFDTTFKTQPASIENKRTKKYECTKGIEITIKSDATDFSHKIFSTMHNGVRVISIICDDDTTYEAFKE